MRYARWAAVSSEAQAAADKVSLDVQLEKGKQAADARGWIEAAGSPYVVPGESRTRWVSLYHAEKQIPELHDLLESAGRGEIDVLYVYDLNRFRDLMRQVFDVLSDYNVQLYVGAYPREPVPPEQYTDELKRSVGMIVDLAGMLSRNEIDNLRAHYRDKMPRRVTEKGLHPSLGGAPYGYRRIDSKTPFEVEPAQAAMLLRMKDDLLSGKRVADIVRELNADKIPSARGGMWTWKAVQDMLVNPFYAGYVRWGETQSVRDRRAGKRRRIKGKPVKAKGKHVALWDVGTHELILKLMRKASVSHAPNKARQFSNLLRCGVCGELMWARIQNRGRRTYLYWSCKTAQAGHASIKHERALDLFIAQLSDLLEHVNDIELPQPDDIRPMLEKELAELADRRKRWLDMYELGSLPSSDVSERIADIDARTSAAQRRLEQLESELYDLRAGERALAELAEAKDAVPDYIRNGSAGEVNAVLRDMLSTVIVRADKSLELRIK